MAKVIAQRIYNLLCYIPAGDLVLALHLVQATSRQGWGDCPSCLSLSHNYPGAARIVSSKGSHPGY